MRDLKTSAKRGTNRSLNQKKTIKDLHPDVVLLNPKSEHKGSEYLVQAMYLNLFFFHPQLYSAA